MKMNAIRLLRGRISHVHLKDRVSKSDMSCPAIGAGCIPEAEVIRILRDSGYSGWLTVEHFGARDMLKAAKESFGIRAKPYSVISPETQGHFHSINISDDTGFRPGTSVYPDPEFFY